ncbi:MAG TPA: TolC family protein, partial [Deltaproteobacteria bacterium]|nr:TolC family protein [Deltaproteobacteria bacterium]
MRMAVERNPQVKAQDQDVLMKQMDERSQFSRMLPTADISYGYARLNEAPSMTLNLGATPTTVLMGTRDNYELNFEARQVLFAGGALYSGYMVAKNETLASAIDRERTVRQIKLMVIDAYYGVIKARQLMEVARSSVASIKSLLDTSQAFFDQGMIPKNNLLETQVRYAETEQGLITAQNAVRLAETNFNLLLVRQMDEEVDIDPDIP